jgi:nitrogen fixation protein FixH
LALKYIINLKIKNMNWGYKIASAYLIFVGGISFLVYKTSQAKSDLVTPDYYAQELKYQDKLDESKRTAALSDSMQVTLKDGALAIKFPKDFTGKNKSGTALLYCPSDENKDVLKDINTISDEFSVPLVKKNKVWYEVQVNYKVDGVSYYFEQKIEI